ncbi:endonuclease/exonuclease/phosphatase family protein [Phaeovulum sp.]|uniref:endonuclease/exonuclease/phosphatase family protein n=1 Tax=Phaeovulum sp. TaxID=2934796 RepID=UPI0039E61276
MRIATYNVEWFSNLFDRYGKLLEDDEWSARYQVTRAQQLGALGIVFTALDADVVTVIEAPDDNRRRHTVAMLERFARHFGLRTRRALLGYSNETQQEIALLYDPDKVSAVHDPQGDGGASPRFDTSYRIDLNTDADPETVTFSKPPLEVALTTPEGRELRLIGVHIKSKAPHGATSPENATRIAIENRRKQLAQCIWLRARVDEHLDAGDSLIVLGDFNDGPGIDEYEKLFGRSGVEIVLGEHVDQSRRLRDPNARLSRGRPTSAAPASARFYLPEAGQFFSAMLDYVMLSPDLCADAPKWRIWHPFDDPACYRVPELREALLQASDHFPVSVDISL